MNRLLIASAFLAVCSLPLSAQARNYDCSKTGNATKAACKGAAATAPAKASAPAAVAATAAKPAAARNYDCSKAGNANKAVCKGAAAPATTAASYAPKPSVAAPAPASATRSLAAAKPSARPGAPTVTWTTKTGKVVHYDCSKAGNQTKQACKG